MAGRHIYKGRGSNNTALPLFSPPSNTNTKNAWPHRKPVEGILFCGKARWGRGRRGNASALGAVGTGGGGGWAAAPGKGGCQGKGPGERGSGGQGQCVATCFKGGQRGQQELCPCGLREWRHLFLDFQSQGWVGMTVGVDDHSWGF